MTGKRFVLSSDFYGAGNEHWDGYYTGKTYIYQGEVYAVCDTDINKAKKYSSLKRAENAAKVCLKGLKIMCLRWKQYDRLPD